MLNKTKLDTSAKSEDALMAFDQNDKDQAKDFIAHHGIKGQKWGRRRYQNSDGSLTAEGRKRYGVGTALDSVKKAGSAAGKAIAKAARKATGMQTDAELDAELAKAMHKHDRQMKKEEINALSGKRKRLDKMTDAEVDAYLNRLNKEKQVRDLEKTIKDQGRGAVSKFVRNTASKAGEGIATGVGEGLKRGISDKIHDTINKKTDDSSKKASDNNKNQLNAYRDELELKALKGDKDAARTLSRVAEAKKGKASEESISSDNETKNDSKPKADPLKMYYDTKLTDMIRPKSGKSIDSYADQLIAQRAQEKADASRRNQAAYYEKKEAVRKALDSKSTTKKKKKKKKNN